MTAIPPWWSIWTLSSVSGQTGSDWGVKEAQLTLDPTGLPRRLRLAREFAGLKQDELGRRVGKSKQTVSKWETLEEAEPDMHWRLSTLQRIARVCGVSDYWLLTGLGNMADASSLRSAGPTKTVKVKLMSLEDVNNPEGVVSEDFIVTHVDSDIDLSPENLIAFRVGDLANAPEIPIGEKILIHRTLAPEPGDFVAAEIVKTGEMVFRRIRFRAGENGEPFVELEALNPDYAPITGILDRDIRVTGVLIQQIRDTRGSKRIAVARARLS
ncbi:MAG: helix-turn-helix domain-containing protein [Dichotomicrobium sp.]